MSTQHNLSTLALEALRSASLPRENTAQRPEELPMGKENKTQSTFSSATRAAPICCQADDISKKNLQLYIENEKLRRCLSLFIENSDLKTMNVLSTVMSMCDDKLRNFVTDTLTGTPTNTTTADVNTTTDYLSSARRTKRQSNETAASNSYGKSFPEIDLNELHDCTFADSLHHSTKTTSPRRGYSPEHLSRSLRPPMRFGVGKSPYQKSPPQKRPEKSPIERSFSAKLPQYSGPYSHSRHISYDRPLSGIKDSTQITNRDTKTHADDTFGSDRYKESIIKRPNSAPSSLWELISKSPEFKINKVSAFSPVKTAQQRNSTKNSPPKYTGQGTSTVSNYQTAQHSLYDGAATNKESAFGGNQSKPTPVKIESILKRQPARSVHWTQAPQDRTVKHQYTENIPPRERYSRSTQTTFVNSTTNSNRLMGGQQTPHDLERGYASTDTQTFQNSFIQQTSPTQTPAAYSTGNTFETIGMPQATSTPRPSPNNNKMPQATSTPRPSPNKNYYTPRQDNGQNSETIPLDSTQSHSARYESNGPYGQGSGTSVDKNVEAPQQSQLPSNGNIETREILRTDITVEQISPAGTAPSIESLATSMGIKGIGATEKAKYILSRPVDILTGYWPNISKETAKSLAKSKPKKRLIGEIAFQLDRRILEFVFAKISDKHCNKRRSRYYGYSVASIMLLIAKEVRHAGNDPEVDLSLRMRLEHILETLQRLGYDIERHSEFTQDMVNKYGLLCGAPASGTVEDIGLREPAVFRVLLGQLIADGQELDDMLIILDCLQYMAHKDEGQLLIW